MTEKAFITGGSGFVGRTLIATLRRNQYDVIALARSEAAVKTVERAGARAVPGDLTDEAALTRGMQGASLVVHAGAKVEQWGPIAEFQRINVEGTANVLRAARSANVPRLVHVSTEAVLVGGKKPLIQADESWPRPAHPPAPYAQTKALAEERVISANCKELTTVVVRPRFIWGKGDSSLLPKLLDSVKRNQFAWIGGGHYLTSTCHVENVAAGILAAAKKGRGGQAYFLTDGAPIEFRAFITSLLESQGVSAPSRSLPHSVAYVAAWLMELVWAAGAKNPPPLTRTMLALMAEEVTVSDAKARAELGYAPVITREQGLLDMRQTEPLPVAQAQGAHAR
jgi:nucleoside-diphosphate-sugar epimerase